MAETKQTVGGGAKDVGREPGNAGEEVRAEEESAKAMEAEVPHPEGYPDPGQEQPS